MIRTKIICTTGPSVDSDDMIEALAKAGMSLMRINCSHGDLKARERHIKRIRRIEKKIGKPIGVMLDLQGPKLRVAELKEPIYLHSESKWCLSSEKPLNVAKKIIPISFTGLAEAVSINGYIYMDDGLIRAQVIKKEGNDVWIQILNGGPLESRKGINIPYYKGDLPVLSAKDRADLTWGLQHKVDFVALSFVRHAEDILQLKALIQKQSKEHMPLLIAKIEKPEAVDNLDAIIEVSDSILVARGDLGIELSLEKVPVIQKRMIEHARRFKKPVIVATQMLDSMRLQPIPTRAEVSDVASAIYAGTDALMLTGETSSGKYPVKATQMLHSIIKEVEDHMIIKDFRKTPGDFRIKDNYEAFAFNLMQLADDIKAKAIVVMNKQGELTKILSKLHPKQPVFSLAMNEMSYRQLTLYWGVFPMETKMRVIEKRIAQGIEILRKKNVVKKSDKILFVYRDFKSENLNMKLVEC